MVIYYIWYEYLNLYIFIYYIFDCYIFEWGIELNIAIYECNGL